MDKQYKQDLTGLCKIEIKRWKAASESNPNMRYMVELMEAALAALTAQPVKLSPIIKIGYTRDEITCMCNVRNEDIESIRAAGYEVQE